MDLYITDSLQDMLDMDIKSEMATDLNSITDFSVRVTPTIKLIKIPMVMTKKL